ncbi:hypothetical protein ACILE2_11260 [Capnocytophaga canimorsus]|uniref:hypothetical protein n=1 Tax=Capnocytophaga canimorsus TaxID=28188 RepID=UPI0037D0D6AF
MKINKKHIIISGVAVLAISLMSFAGAKKAQASEVFEKMILKITGLRGFDISLQRLRFYVDLTLQNTTAHDFTLSSSGMIRGKAYRVYRGDTLLVGGSLNNINGINLPAGGFFTFKNIQVEVPLSALGQQVMDLIGGFDGIKNLFQSGGFNQTISKINWQSYLQSLRYEVDIEGFGSIFTFKDNVKV